MLILVSGLPATGKSTVANQIAKDIDAVVLRTDMIRKELFRPATAEEIQQSKDPYKYDIEGAFSDSQAVPDEYQRLIWRQKEKVYDTLLIRLKELLKSRNVVLDATFYKKDFRKRIYDAARDMKIISVLTECSDECVKARMSRRQIKPDKFSNAKKMQVYKKVKSVFENPRLDGNPIFIYNTGTHEVEEIDTSKTDPDFETIRDSIGKLNIRYK